MIKVVINYFSKNYRSDDAVAVSNSIHNLAEALILIKDFPRLKKN